MTHGEKIHAVFSLIFSQAQILKVSAVPHDYQVKIINKIIMIIYIYMIHFFPLERL